MNASGVSVRNTARHIKKYGPPGIQIKRPWIYENRWRTKFQGFNKELLQEE